MDNNEGSPKNVPKDQRSGTFIRRPVPPGTSIGDLDKMAKVRGLEVEIDADTRSANWLDWLSALNPFKPKTPKPPTTPPKP